MLARFWNDASLLIRSGDRRTTPLLEVTDLHVEFDTYGGTVHAVRGATSVSKPAKRWRSSANRAAASRSPCRASWV